MTLSYENSSNMSTVNDERVGVVLMTYGSATTADQVPEYLAQIYKGVASQATIEEFQRRYSLVGHSPLVQITEEQARLLNHALGEKYIVRAGMLHSVPFIDAAIAECAAAGITRLIGILLSPQFSSLIMSGYERAFTDAAQRHGFPVGQTLFAEPWHSEPNFIEFVASRITESLTVLEKKYRNHIPIIFTTHSLPRRVTEKDPAYISQLTATIDAVLGTLGRRPMHYAGYQSAGHTPEEWLKPDLFDILNQVKSHNARAVLIVPIQFVADHLEVLYDLDIAARAQCTERNIAYHRIALPNTDPLFIDALKNIVKKGDTFY